MLLEVIRGATVRLPRVWGEVGYKIWEAMCLPLASLSRITSLYTCTLAHLSEVCCPDVLNLFIGMIEVPPGLPSHSDRPIFPSQFYFPISPVTPCLKVDRWGPRSEKRKKEKRRPCLAGLTRSSDLHFSAFHPDALCA